MTGLEQELTEEISRLRADVRDLTYRLGLLAERKAELFSRLKGELSYNDDLIERLLHQAKYAQHKENCTGDSKGICTCGLGYYP